MKDKPKSAPMQAQNPAGEKLFSPSTARNRDPIRTVFLETMPKTGQILELAGGAGEHAVDLAKALPDVRWLTGDPDARARASIAAWIADSGLSNLSGPHAIDVRMESWGVEGERLYDGLVSINMIHIAPIEAAEGLFAGAKRLLRAGGKLFLYGPFSRNGVHTAPSNEAFDKSLKARDASWGVRDLEQDIAPLAQKNSLVKDAVVEMPANNLCVVFRKI